MAIKTFYNIEAGVRDSEGHWQYCDELTTLENVRWQVTENVYDTQNATSDNPFAGVETYPVSELPTYKEAYDKCFKLNVTQQ
jgi:hypothetical protein